MKTIKDLQNEAEDFFLQLELDRDKTNASYESIINTINGALVNSDYMTLFSLIPYIENGDGNYAFRYIGNTHRILRILHIMQLEHKYNTILFSENCTSFEELMQKYMLTLFALRRLYFNPSSDSVSEAITYLQANPISHFAAYMILNQDLVPNNIDIINKLILIYTDIWGKVNTEQFRQFTHQIGEHNAD